MSSPSSISPLETAHTPRRPSSGGWFTRASSCAIVGGAGGALLVSLAPVAGAAYWWVFFAVVVALCAWAAVNDERTMRLPNTITAALAAFAVVQVAGIAVWTHDAAFVGSVAAAAGIVVAVYLVLAVTGSCGFGDVKFAGALTVAVGAFIGFSAIGVLYIAVALSALRIVVRWVRRKPIRHPHGASIAAGGVVLLVLAMLSGTVLAGL